MQTGKQIIPHTFSTDTAEDAYESEMRSAWERMPEGVTLRLADGSRTRILSRGIRNRKAGPDFLDVEILRNGKILRGDVELHRRSSDFIRRGHLNDAAYLDVILLIVAEDDLGADPEAPLRELPVFLMEKEKFDAFLRHPEQSGICRVFPFLDDSGLRSCFTSAGIERIRKKSEIILASMIAEGSTRGFLERLFAAAGYQSNTHQFGELLKRYLKYPESLRKKHVRAILWGESGLLPDPAAETLPEASAKYAAELWKEFWSLRLCALPEIEWSRASIRPANTPERRLAMLCVFLERFTENPLPAFSADLLSMDAAAFRKKYLRLFRCSDPFWDCRFTFRSRQAKRPLAVLSTARALTFFADVLIPSLLASAKLRKNETLEKAALRVLEVLPATESNATFRKAVRTWFPGEETYREKLFSSALLRQGCIHIYRNYCADGAACGSCPLAKSQGKMPWPAEN